MRRLLTAFLMMLMLVMATTCQAFFHEDDVNWECVYGDQMRAVYVEHPSINYNIEENTCSATICEYTFSDGSEVLTGLVFDFNAGTFTSQWDMFYNSKGKLKKTREHGFVERKDWTKVMPHTFIGATYEFLEPKG